MRFLLIPVTLALLGNVTVGAKEPALQTTAPKHAAEPATGWDYSNQRGPEHWGELNPDYVLARIGGSQSPVDIRPETAIGADLPPLSVEPHEQPLHLLNNGRTVEAVCPGAATLRFGVQSYNLLQFHFHAPSEHTIDGKHAEVELHLVHSDGEGHLAVVAVLFHEGEVEHPEIAELLTRDAVSHPGDEIVDESTYIDARDLLPASLDYYTYDGSLTTPPRPLPRAYAGSC
jgi:carbonic anhydrase